MVELGRVLRRDARPAAVVVPALATTGSVVAWITLPGGGASWDSAVLVLGCAVRLMGPLAAALAAGVAVRERRLDYLRGLAARSPVTGPLLDLLILELAALLSYGLVTVIVIVNVAVERLPDPALALGVLSGASALGLHVVVGYFAGRLVPRLAVVAAVAVLTGSWAALRAPGASWVSLLPPAVLGRIEPFTTVRGEVLAEQSYWAAGLAGTLLAGYVLVVTRRVVAVAALAGLIGLTAHSTVRLASWHGNILLPSADGLACRHWPLTICVHPAMREALPTLETALTPLAARLATTPAAFHRVIQQPAHRPTSIRRGTAYIRLPELTSGYEHRVVYEIQGSLPNERACAGRPLGRAYREVVDRWLRGQPVLPLPIPTTAGLPPLGVDASVEAPEIPAHTFAGWNLAQRRSWLGAHYKAYRTCRLSHRHFQSSLSARRPG
jgi:hypothetical protein